MRDIHDEFESFERQSITFIVLQPGSKVIVPPNPNNKDPAYSEAICDGGAVCLENGVYELEWSGGIVGFSSQTAEEFTDSGASITFFETDQFDTELCFVVLESQTAVPSSTGFTDVKATDFFAKPVKWALERQITGGHKQDPILAAAALLGQSNPDVPVSRQRFAGNKNQQPLLRRLSQQLLLFGRTMGV